MREKERKEMMKRRLLFLTQELEMRRNPSARLDSPVCEEARDAAAKEIAMGNERSSVVQ